MSEARKYTKLQFKRDFMSFYVCALTVTATAILAFHEGRQAGRAECSSFVVEHMPRITDAKAGFLRLEAAVLPNPINSTLKPNNGLYGP